MSRALVTRRNKLAIAEGLGELQDRIAAVIDKTTGQEAKKIWMHGALVIRDEARDLAPVLKTPDKRRVAGLLKSAIRAAYGDPAKPNVLVFVDYRIAPHAHLVEYGTSKMPAQPYMRPALLATRAKCVAIIAEGYRGLIEKAGA